MDPALQRIDSLKQEISQTSLPDEVAAKLQNEVTRIELLLKSQSYSLEADRLINYVKFVCGLPYATPSQDILDIKRAQEILDKNHFGLDSVKEKILEYLSVVILNRRRGQKTHLSSLAFVGLVGSGKTSLAYSIAESLGRPIVRIPFGGLASASQLRGESRLKLEAEPGLILKALKSAKAKNPVILLDELDRVAQDSRADIMGVLVEILDPEQNINFLDHFLEIPFDLSEVLFVATANNLNNISTAVLDRLEVVEMPFYTDNQKVAIAREYLLPQALKEAGLAPDALQFDQGAWVDIVRPLGFDGGIRSLKRSIQQIVRKVARMVVGGRVGPFVITSQNIHEYLNNM